MTTPKHSISYAPEYHSLWNILSLGDEPRIELPMSEKAATAFRFKFYGLVKAKRAEAQTTADPQRNTAITRELTAVARYSLKVTPKGFVAQLRGTEAPELNAALDAILADILQKKATAAAPTHHTDAQESIVETFFTSTATPANAPPSNPLLDAMSDTGTHTPSVGLTATSLFEQWVDRIAGVPLGETFTTPRFTSDALASDLAAKWNGEPQYAAIATATVEDRAVKLARVG